MMNRIVPEVEIGPIMPVVQESLAAPWGPVALDASRGARSHGNGGATADSEPANATVT